MEHAQNSGSRRPRGPGVRRYYAARKDVRRSRQQPFPPTPASPDRHGNAALRDAATPSPKHLPLPSLQAGSRVNTPYSALTAGRTNPAAQMNAP